MFQISTDILRRFAIYLTIGILLVLSTLALRAQAQIPFGGTGGDPFSLTAKFESYENGNKGVLTVTAEIEYPWHVYSITQPDGGPTRSEIIIEDDKKFKVTGDFEADSDPISKVEESFAPVPSEYHENEISWRAPIEFSEGVDPKEIAIEVSFAGLRCADAMGCVPIRNVQAVANHAGVIKSIDENAPLRAKGSHLLISGKVSKGNGKGSFQPGDQGIIEITLEPVDGHHVYQLTDEPVKEGNKSTLLVINKTNDWKFGATETVVAADKIKSKDGLQHYTAPVTFKIPFTIDQSAETKEYTVGGLLGFQTCTDSGCDRPTGVKWEVAIPVDVVASSSPNLRILEDGVSYDEIAKKAADLNRNSKPNAGAWAGYSPAFVLPLAFLAGFILNFMPCVLPVVGLKIMSFMHMAGENPRRVFMLNLVFVLGMLAVFMAFAALAVAFGFGWGEAYTNLPFKVTMIAIVFGFGLSFFGVWEIPMPGVVNSDAANHLANKEGYVGQFFKGILTTLLATPCSGPMLIPAVVWAMAQPPLMTFTVFLCLGLGMAFPYLVIGAFPKLAGFLPKPGGWMETFKQVMGFVLMATTIFLIGGVSQKYTISLLTLLLFMGIGCWWIGRTELHEPISKQLKAWASGLALIAIGVWIAFVAMIPQYELDYQKFSRLAIENHLKEGRTVLIDFTADW